jgi:hypothetical protein
MNPQFNNAPGQCPPPNFNFNMGGPPPLPLPLNPQYNPVAPQPYQPQQEQWLNYPDGTRYFGHLIRNQQGNLVPNGYGKLFFQNGNQYVGEFQWGKRNGVGTETYPNGDKYVGNWSFDRFHGQGQSFRMVDQRQYYGMFVNGVEEGWATITCLDLANPGVQKKYEGHVKNGVRHGRGTMEIKYGKFYRATFEGTWSNGLLQGPGTQSDNVRVVEGNFYNGFFEGVGYETELATSIRRRVEFSRGNIIRYL